MRRSIRTLIVAVILHVLASWTFVLINDLQSYALDIPTISQNAGMFWTPLWMPALLLYDIFSFTTYGLDISNVSRCALDWVDYMLPLAAWWGLWRLARAAVYRVKSSREPLRWRLAHRAVSAFSFGVALLLVVNAYALHWGTYLSVGKGSHQVGVYKGDSCVLLYVDLSGATIRTTDEIIEFSPGIAWGKDHSPSGFWFTLKIPLWVLSVPLVGLGFFFHYRLKCGATNAFLCRKCRYDLRAHSPGTKCPECGTPVPDRVTQPAKTV